MPDWYNSLVARVSVLPEPLRSYGMEQCADALATYKYSGDWRIPHQLQEEVESLEFGLSQIRGMSPGQQQAELARARLTLYL